MKRVGEFRLKAVLALLAAIRLIAARTFFHQHPLAGARAFGNQLHARILGASTAPDATRSMLFAETVVMALPEDDSPTDEPIELPLAQPPASIPITAMIPRRLIDLFIMPIHPRYETDGLAIR